MSTAEQAAETVMVSQLRNTEALDHGKIRQTFDVINCPGITVVCVSQGFEDGEIEPLSQTYHLFTGEVFESPSEALLAWDSRRDVLDALDAVGHALLRYRHGLMRPLWHDRKAAEKAVWLNGARVFTGLLNSLGFEIVRKAARS